MLPKILPSIIVYRNLQNKISLYNVKGKKMITNKVRIIYNILYYFNLNSLI